MGKKKKKILLSRYETYKRLRKSWSINPKTRIKDSDKKYRREQAKKDFRKEIENND